MAKQSKKQSKPKGKKQNKTSPPISLDSNRTNVNIRKVSNGFVINSYGDKGEKTVIAAIKDEAKAAANKMLGI